MILNKEQKESFKKITSPLIKWLNDNCNPYVKVVVDCRIAEILETIGWRKIMILNEEQQESFEKIIRPLIKWLNDNCCPYVNVIIDCRAAELLETVGITITDDYLVD